MASENSRRNGTHFPNLSANGLLVNGGHSEKDHAQGDHAVFDARVHSVSAAKLDAVITILLRRNGQFVKALLEPESADVVSLDTARRLTAESLVRVSGSTIPENQHANNEAVSEVVTVRVSKLVTLSEAKADLLESLKLHGAPGEKLPPLASRAALIDERLNNRLLDARVVATAAIFKLFSGVHELAVEYLAAIGFYHIPTPAFINYEFPGEEDDHFSVPYFDKTAWLAPTGEVHLGMALAADLERVYDIHTVFRREGDVDGRHLTEV
jgi:aspartyl-tRNA synthetase